MNNVDPNCRCCHAGVPCTCCSIHKNAADYLGFRHVVTNLPTGSAFFNPAARRTYAGMVQLSEQRARQENRLTVSHVLEADAAEALVHLAAGDTEQARVKLLVLASTCLAAVEGLRRAEP